MAEVFREFIGGPYDDQWRALDEDAKFVTVPVPEAKRVNPLNYEAVTYSQMADGAMVLVRYHARTNPAADHGADYWKDHN